VKQRTQLTSALLAIAAAAAMPAVAHAAGAMADPSASSAVAANACTPEIRQKCGETAPAAHAPKPAVRKRVAHAAPAGLPAPVAAGDAPPQAEPGQCYARVVTPARYESYTENALLAPASKRIEVMPARYGDDVETVVVKEASKRIEVVPATYKTVTEQVEVRPATKRLEVVPATYETVTERVLVKEAYTTWKRGRSWIGSAKALRGSDGQPLHRDDALAKGSDDEVVCLVEMPAEYKTVTHKVEKSAATTREIDVPAEYTTVTRRVVDREATTREVEIPAVTRTVAVKKIVEPAKEHVVELPAQYQVVSKTRQVAAGSYEWRQVLCEVNATPAKITEIQRALVAAGYNPGQTNGVVTPETMRAVHDYQTAKALPTDSYINMETVKALGISSN
jgi:hypothetical protein